MHDKSKIPAMKCPRCLGDGRQQPQNCGVCVECHGHGTVPNHELTLITSLAAGCAERSYARPRDGFVPDLFAHAPLGAIRHFKVAALAEVA